MSGEIKSFPDICSQDILWLRRAIELSKISAQKGGSPFGAVVAAGDRLLGEGGNETLLNNIPIHHAEVVAISNAIKSMDGDILPSSATLYSSCAPCFMCLGTAFYGGIKRIIYSLHLKDVVPLGSGDPLVEPDDLNESLLLGIEIHSGVLHPEALEVVLQTYRERGQL